MRSRLSILLLLVLLAFIFVASRLYAFVQIFFEHAGISVTQHEAALLHSSGTDLRKQYVPKIIHQVYHDWRNKSIPVDWDQVRQTCISLNQDWEYKLWTQTTSRDFISANYPWFLSTYDGYSFPVQRVDATRYFLLFHYGGIYLDLDNGCLEDLTPLLYYPTWITDGGRGALSNNVLGSQANHPFWKLLIDSLIPYNYNYFFPYITISYASGQWFETAIWQKYHHSVAQENSLHRLMMDNRPGADPWIFFTQARGGTWRNWDNAFFLWIGDHLLLIVCTSAAAIGVLLWVAIRRFVHQPSYVAGKRSMYDGITRDLYP